MPIVLLGSVGAITWAIRGTDGWGGIDGTILPGMSWGILWWWLCFRRGIDARGTPLWLGLGIALGGELGYGQYVAWIRGMFYLEDEIISISPWTGYLWFFICGIGWGAPGGVLLGWALSRKKSLAVWAARLLIPAGVAYLGWLLVQWRPEWFFPHHELGIYEGELSRHQDRTVYTNTQNFVVVAWWLGALMVALFQRDRFAWMAMLLIGGGFGFGFTLAALWCLGYSYAPDLIDWWKMWELNSGFNLGLLYTLLLYWTIRQVDTEPEPEESPTRSRLWFESIGMALGGFLLVYLMGAEFFAGTGFFLALMVAIPILLATRSGKQGFNPDLIMDRRKEVAFTYAIFLLLFMLFWGVTSRLGVVLGLYDPSAVNQYAWPPARIALFVPFGILVVGYTLVRYFKVLTSTDISSNRTDPARAAILLVDLMTLIGIVGAISIWPAKIGACYAIFLFLALFAFNRINHRFNQIDQG
ncbi:MAG: hypothetical protein KC944_24485 [Candidatus Omnitrophica bacterium]|nr:hypothetical protein [Candidatus Omnitrophota bacterium]